MACWWQRVARRMASIRCFESKVDALKEETQDTEDPDKKVHIQARLMYSDVQRECNHCVARGEGVDRQIKASELQIAENGQVAGNGVFMMKRHLEEFFAKQQAEIENVRNAHQAELRNVQLALDVEKEENTKLKAQLKEANAMVNKLRPVAMQHVEFDRLLTGLLRTESDALSSGCCTEPVLASTEVLPSPRSLVADSTVPENPRTLERDILRQTHRMLEENLSQCDILRQQLRQAHGRIKAWIVRHDRVPSSSSVSLPNWTQEVESLLGKVDAMVAPRDISLDNLHEVQTFLRAVKVQKTRLVAALDEAQACLPYLSRGLGGFEAPVGDRKRAPPQHPGQPRAPNHSAHGLDERMVQPTSQYKDASRSSLPSSHRIPTDSPIVYSSSSRSPLPRRAPHCLSVPTPLHAACLSPKSRGKRPVPLSPRSALFRQASSCQRSAILGPGSFSPQPALWRKTSFSPKPAILHKVSSASMTCGAAGVPSVAIPQTRKDDHRAVTCDADTQQGSQTNASTHEVTNNSSVLKEQPAHGRSASPKWIPRLKSMTAIKPPSCVFNIPTMQCGHAATSSTALFSRLAKAGGMGRSRGMAPPSTRHTAPTMTELRKDARKKETLKNNIFLRRAVLSAPSLRSLVLPGDRELAITALRPSWLKPRDFTSGRPLASETNQKPMVAP